MLKITNRTVLGQVLLFATASPGTETLTLIVHGRGGAIFEEGQRWSQFEGDRWIISDCITLAKDRGKACFLSIVAVPQRGSPGSNAIRNDPPAHL